MPELSDVLNVNWTNMNDTLALTGTTMVDAGHEMVGGLWSVIVTKNWQVLLSPALSVTEQLTGDVERTVNVDEFVGVHVYGALLLFAIPLASDDETLVYLTVCCMLFEDVGTLMLGQVSVGGVVSTTIIKKEHFAVLPALSVAVQVTLVGPRLKVLPEAGEHDADLTPEPESVAVGLNATFCACADV